MNRERPHILVLPEDRANAEIATGFSLNIRVDDRRIKVEREAGGWGEVLNRFEETYKDDLLKNPNGILIMLIDFDSHADRIEKAKSRIPDPLKERVFVLGSWSEPEKLRKALGVNFEKIGGSLADDCYEDITKVWTHDLLKHNLPELRRLRSTTSKFIFRKP